MTRAAAQILSRRFHFKRPRNERNDIRMFNDIRTLRRWVVGFGCKKALMSRRRLSA